MFEDQIVDSVTSIWTTSSSSRELCEAGGDFIKTTQEVASLYPVIGSVESTSCVVLQNHVRFCKIHECYNGKLRIVPLLLGAAQIFGCVIFFGKWH